MRDDLALSIINGLGGNLRSGMLLCASSPYAKRGVLWDAYRRHYGKDAATTLVWKAPTRVMHPSIPQSIIDEAMLQLLFFIGGELSRLDSFLKTGLAFVDHLKCSVAERWSWWGGLELQQRCKIETG